METTVKDAKEYLLQIRLLDAQIDCMLSTVNGLRESLLRITPTLKQDVVSGSSAQDRMSTTIAKIVDLEKEINAKVDAMVDRKAQVIHLLEKVRNPDYLTILQRRYVDLCSFEEIAAEMHYTYRWICKLHGRALQTFKKIMDEEKKEILFNESERT
jgi:hypothetical protein